LFCVQPVHHGYLVAARGYGLALGFLSLAVYLFARTLVRDGEELSEREILNREIGISTCVALSIWRKLHFRLRQRFSVAGRRIAAVYGGSTEAWGARAVASYCRVSFPAVVILVVLAGSALTRFHGTSYSGEPTHC